MSVIKPRTRGKQFVGIRARLDRENHETLHAYAQFLGEPSEYVLNQLIESVLEKDKEFVAWRATHPESYAPAPIARPRHRTSVRPTAAPAPLAQVTATGPGGR